MPGRFPDPHTSAPVPDASASIVRLTQPRSTVSSASGGDQRYAPSGEARQGIQRGSVPGTRIGGAASPDQSTTVIASIAKLALLYTSSRSLRIVPAPCQKGYRAISCHASPPRTEKRAFRSSDSPLFGPTYPRPE